MIWKLIALILCANNSRLGLKLFERAKRTPYFHLTGYMDRFWLFQTPWLCARFHLIKRADAGRHLHDHPFWFRSIILRGSYLEERLDGEINYYHPGYVNSMDPHTWHRIGAICGSSVLTLVFHGPRLSKSWGFLVDGTRIHHTEYDHVTGKAKRLGGEK